MPRRSLNRRTFLRGAAGGALASVALPPLEAMLNTNGTAYADGGLFPKRFGVWYWGNGTQLQRWVPTQTGVGWATPELLLPFQAKGVLDQISILSGYAFKFPNTAVHDVGRAAVLSGSWDPLAPPAPGALQGNATLPSVDQIAADFIAEDTIFRSIEIGVSKVGFGNQQDLSSTSWIDPINLLPAEFSPHALFERLFGEGLNPDTTVRDSRLSVLDAVASDAESLQKKLGANDKQRLQSHLESIRKIENRLTVGAPSCAIPDDPGDFPPLSANEEQLQEISEAMSDLLAIALVCDLTRVFNFRFTQMLSDAFFWQVGSMEGYHTTTHTDELFATVGPILDFTMNQFAYTLQKIAELPEGDGTVLDNCCILGTSEVAEGYTHEPTDMPFLVAGRAGGTLQPGVHVRSATEENVSLIPFTLLKAVGAEVEEFGMNEGLVTDTIGAIEA